MSLEELMGNLSLRPNNRHRGRRRRDRPKLFILRGLPGSGKSTLARQIRNEFGSAEIFSTDDFFRDESGRYHFKARELREAHEWNKERAKEAMEEGLNPIIIDNTNIHAWEMKPYVRMISIQSRICGICWKNKSHPWTPHLADVQDLKDVLLTSWWQIPLDTFRSLAESVHQWVRAVLSKQAGLRDIR
ncbi:NEDD4-binding protein 2-like 1 isoform X1 [Erpetoichthys calabaricus]|uniref:NEDD4-binding protein 2-like 1 isoform X1 n=1 Tax=Erpetoichthys calabaricus TaxID=27687 RepID=UPI002233F9A4|nr:NEDD4-binding protein 2-like 1 isoform X1 [Erpetoichthys calabaricus]